MTRNFKENLIVVSILFVVGFFIYKNTLNVPWYFDDFDNIVKNESIRDLKGAFGQIFSSRGVAYFSFALNYAFGELNTTGYHIVNIFIHIGCSILVFFILKEIYRESVFMPFVGATIFLIHPIQTQSVTYIVQRMASLECLFFMISIYLYIKSRKKLIEKVNMFASGHLIPYAFSVFFAVVAFLTKENAIILPFVLLAIDRYLVENKNFNLRKSLAYISPYLLAFFLFGILQIFAENSTMDKVRHLTEFFELSANIPGVSAGSYRPDNLALRYFSTELIVMWEYLRLFLLPVQQVLDYCYPLVNNALNLKSILSLCVIILAIILVLKFSNNKIKFGLMWFLITLSVESTFIPLDPLFEHRLYVPIIGLIIIFIESVFVRMPFRFSLIAFSTVSIVLGFMTVNRNSLWARPLDFWEDNVAKVSHCYRPKVNLSQEYLKLGRYDDVIKLLEDAKRSKPLRDALYFNLGDAYYHKGMLEEAKKEFEYAIIVNTKSIEGYINLGSVLSQMGNYQKAIFYINKAVELDPGNCDALYNLGVVYEKKGEFPKAEEVYRKTIICDPKNASGHFGLGVALYRQGRLRDSLGEFELATNLSPENAEALFNYASVAIEIGEIEKAKRVSPKLRKLSLRFFEEIEKEIKDK